MYNEHFGLAQAPFKITPDTRLFFPGGGRGEILEALIYAVTSGEGITKVVGEVGSGKTMLCRMLEERLPEHVEVVYLANPSLSPDDILQAIALEMSLDLPPDANRLRVMHALQQRLLEMHADNRHVVVFVEEAQSMPLETLEEIRLLSNLETTNNKLLQIVLFGQPELDENLMKSNIRQLNERITHSFELKPLSSEEIKDYVNFRLRAVGYRGRDAFRTTAYHGIARASEGLTRRVNILADKALLAAYADDVHDVSRRHVQIAIADSQFNRRLRRRWPEISLAFGAVLVVAAGVLTYGHLPTFRGLLDAADASSPTGERTVMIADGATGAAPAPVPVATVREEPEAGPVMAASTAAPVGSALPTRPSKDDRAASGRTSRAVEAVARAPQLQISPAPQALIETLAEPPAWTPTVDASEEAVAAAAIEEEVATFVAPEITPRLEVMASGVSASDAPKPVPLAKPESVAARMGPLLPEATSDSVGVVSTPTATDAGNGAVPTETSSPRETYSRAAQGDSGSLVERRLMVTRDWLERLDANHYSIQLLVTDQRSRSNLEEYLRARERAGQIDDVFVYETIIGNRTWFGVLYGAFSTLTAARGALSALPEEIAQHGPFIRNVRDISILG